MYADNDPRANRSFSAHWAATEATMSKFKAGDRVRVQGYWSEAWDGREGTVHEVSRDGFVTAEFDGKGVARFEARHLVPARRFKVGDKVRAHKVTDSDGEDITAQFDTTTRTGTVAQVGGGAGGHWHYRLNTGLWVADGEVEAYTGPTWKAGDQGTTAGGQDFTVDHVHEDDDSACTTDGNNVKLTGATKWEDETRFPSVPVVIGGEGTKAGETWTVTKYREGEELTVKVVRTDNRTGASADMEVRVYADGTFTLDLGTPTTPAQAQINFTLGGIGADFAALVGKRVSSDGLAWDAAVESAWNIFHETNDKARAAGAEGREAVLGLLEAVFGKKARR